MRIVDVTGALVLACTLGCTWVPLTPAGEAVAVTATNEVADCERIGSTQAKVVRKLWFIPRTRSVVQRELDTLARNEAAELGGNTVTHMTDEEEGRRDFAVYTCGD
jgi:hypothetical protein